MIKNIIIEVGGKEISLTIDEAKKLKRDLDLIFTSTELKFPNHPIYPNYPKYDITCLIQEL